MVATVSPPEAKTVGFYFRTSQKKLSVVAKLPYSHSILG
jgi:hypothetical protein